MDYCLEMKRFIVDCKKEYTMDMLAIMESESDFIVSCMEAMEIVDGFDVLREAKDGISLWEKVKEFFKNLFNIFTDKLKKLVNRDLAWLEKNEARLKDADCSNIELEVLPFWNMNFGKVQTLTDNTIRQIFKDVQSFKKVIINVADKNDKAKDAVKFDVLSKYDKGNGATEGFKNFLRCGNAETAKPVKIGGSTLKGKINDFITYCKNYEKDVVPFIKKEMAFIDKEVGRIEKQLKSVKEHTIFIENCNVLETDLRYLSGFDSILEADDNKKDDKPSPTSITVNKKEDPKSDENGKDNKKNDEKGNTDRTVDYKKSTGAELRYLNEGLSHAKLVLTTAMSVCEEKYITYMKILRAIAPKDTKQDTKEETKQV